MPQNSRVIAAALWPTTWNFMRRWRATHHELFALLLNASAEIVRKVHQLGFPVPGFIAHAVAAHRAIFEKIRPGNPDGARQSMRLHLLGSEEILCHAFVMQPITAGA